MKYLFVFAHPDDETFTSAGTIALLTKKGHTVKTICATKGEAGLVGNPPLTTQETLPIVREQEMRNAAKVLGVSEIFFLGFIDGTLHSIPLKILYEPIIRIFEKEKPDVVITFGKEGGSKHPDHIRIGKVTTRVFHEYMGLAKKHVRLYHTVSAKSYIRKLKQDNKMHYTFGEIKGTKDEDITTAVAIHNTRKEKIRALQCHKTQHKDVDRFLSRRNYEEYQYEYFLLVKENTLSGL